VPWLRRADVESFSREMHWIQIGERRANVESFSQEIMQAHVAVAAVARLPVFSVCGQRAICMDGARLC